MSATFSHDSTANEVLAGIDLSGKTALITGVSAGLGVELAKTLVAHGVKVVGTARDLAKADKATEAVREAAKSTKGSLEIIHLDLASLASVRDAADQLLKKGDNFDYIFANAGIMNTPFGRTIDGFEQQLGVNVLGHFVFVNRLAPLVKAGGRIIIYSSSAHRIGDFNLDDPNYTTTESEYEENAAYARAKTGNALHALALDNRLKAKGVRVASVHPGVIFTELARHMDMEAFLPVFQSFQDELIANRRPAFSTKTPEQGISTAVWAAFVADENEIGGKYAEDCHVARIMSADEKLYYLDDGQQAYITDAKHADNFWAKAEELVGEKFAF